MPADPGLRFDAQALDSLLQDWAAELSHHHTALPEPLSPCRIDPAKGARRHRCSTWHRELVDSYRDAKHAQHLREQEIAMGYAEETAAFYRAPGAAPGPTSEHRLTFTDWLHASRRPHTEDR